MKPIYFISDSDYNLKIIQAFKQLSLSGTSLYFVHGNRDFLLGEIFATACGGKLLGERTVIDMPTGKLLVEHGDALCTRDEKFMAFRVQSRHPVWQQPENIMDVTPQAVIDLMTQQQVTSLLHGHTHRPMIHKLALANEQTGVRIVLGDWQEETGTAVIGIANEQGISLENYTF